MRTIESKDNPLFKTLFSLKRPSLAKKQQLALIEGPRHISDMFKAGIVPEYLFFADDEKGRALQQILCEDIDLGDRVILLSPALFSQVSQQTSAQGVLAMTKLYEVTWDTWIRKIDQAKELLRVLILESVQDPGNVGTLIRSADALGFCAVLLAGDTASLYNPKTLQAAMGSQFHLDVIDVTIGIEECLKQLKDKAFMTIGAALKGISVEDFHFGLRSAIVLGNEGNGLSEQALEGVDHLVTIPMAGAAESLNVSAAGTILMWEAVRGKV